MNGAGLVAQVAALKPADGLFGLLHAGYRRAPRLAFHACCMA
jgi:hypothetical protein